MVQVRMVSHLSVFIRVYVIGFYKWLFFEESVFEYFLALAYRGSLPILLIYRAKVLEELTGHCWRARISTVAGDRYLSCNPTTAQPLRMGHKWNNLSVKPFSSICFSVFNSSAVCCCQSNKRHSVFFGMNGLLRPLPQ